MRWPALLIGIILVVAVVIFAVSYGEPALTKNATSTTEIIPGTPSILHQDTEHGFTVLRPASVDVRANGFVENLPVTQKPLVAFALPQTISTGTNLVEAGLYLGASSEAAVLNSCLTALEGEMPVGTKIIRNTAFSVFSSGGVAAGNSYERTSYRIARNGTCYELVEMIHSGNIANYPANTVREFDRESIRAILDAMLQSFAFTSISGSGVEGSVKVRCLADARDGVCAPQVRVVEAYQGASSVGLFRTGLDGTFRAELPAGHYELRVDAPTSTRCVSVGVVIPTNSFISTNISCDAGV